MSNSEEIGEALHVEDRWRGELTISVRADKLYWLMVLAEAGLKAKRAEFKENERERPEPWSAATAAANLAAWQIDMQEITADIVAAAKKPVKKARKK